MVKLFFGFTHIEGIILVVSGEVDEVAEGANGMGVNRLVRFVAILVKGSLLGCMGRFYSWVFGREV